VSQDLKGIQEALVHLEDLEIQGTLAFLDHLGHLDQLEVLEHQVQLEQKATQDPVEEQATQVQRVHWVGRVLPVQLGLQDRKVTVDLLVPLEYLVYQDQLE